MMEEDEMVEISRRVSRRHPIFVLLESLNGAATCRGVLLHVLHSSISKIPEAVQIRVTAQLYSTIDSKLFYEVWLDTTTTRHSLRQRYRCTISFVPIFF